MEKYHHLEKIAEGPHSTVFTGINKQDNEKYVLKFIELINLNEKEINQ